MKRRKSLNSCVRLAAGFLLCIFALCAFCSCNNGNAGSNAASSNASSVSGESSSQSSHASENASTAPGFEEIDLGNGLFLKSLGTESASFIETGSDTDIDNMLFAVVENCNVKTLQYVVVNGKVNGKDVSFEISTVPAGERVKVFEKAGASAPDISEYGSFSLESFVLFDEKESTYPDVFEITSAQGIINIRNISDKDISGDIYIYYKNYKDGMYYGGITYRTGFSGGLKAGQVRQLSASHYSITDGRVMFIKYGQ